MKRRTFISLVGGAAAAWPLAARAQDISKPARLGYIWIGPKDSEHSTRDCFRQGMRDLGYVEGRDYVLEERYADSQPERLPGIIAELLQLKVALFLSPGVQVTKALMAATSTVPIIATTPDLLASGFVTSLARPGGNVTGMSLTAGPTLSEKWLEILKETFPSVTAVAMLTASGAIYHDRIRAAAEMLGLNVRYFPAQDPQEIDRALADIAAMAPDGLIVESDANLVSNRAKILDFVARHRLPTVYGNLDYIPDGGVMAYFTSIFETWRRLATYVDRVLKGAKPGDLPVEQAAAWPLAARAQQPERMRRIGVLMAYAESDREGQAWIAAFREGLQKVGWAVGGNIRIDYGWAAADAESRQRIAKELVAHSPDLIVTQNTPTTEAVVQQTRTIPIIFANVSDPVGRGFVASFSRPGGNVTGFINFEGSLSGKWLELLKETAPRVDHVAFLFNPATAPARSSCLRSCAGAVD